MVARHTRRPGWHSADGCVCIDCGTRYLFTNTYKGNYCPACHTRWVDRQRDGSSPRSPRVRPRSRRFSVDSADTETDSTDINADEE